MKKQVLLILLFLVTGFSWASAQTKITGRVIDAATSEPIPFASVAIKGTSKGVVTGEDGKYAIEASGNATLLVSYLGYKTIEEKINSRTVIDLSMQPDAALLDEVVVTATGGKPRRGLTYAMDEIKGSEIANTNVVNSINALQGKIAGVQINMGNSGPQSAQRIIIRGNTSLGTNNQPIFVIDGVIIDNNTTGPDKWGSGLDFGNDIKNLNSDDFESLSVLKGAAATALYGSRAANGVILITTKKGRKGEGVGVTVSHAQQWEKAYDGPAFQNQYGDGWSGTTSVWALNPDGTENRNRTYQGVSFGPAFDGLPYTMNGREEIWRAVPDNFLQAYQTGHQANTNVAIHGGSESNTFRISYSNLQSNGLQLNNDFSRNSFSANVSQKISKFLDAEASFSFVQSVSRNPQAQGGGGSIVYDFANSLPRSYDTKYWLNNYKNSDGSGRNTDDYTKYDNQMWNWLENNKEQTEDTYRGYVNLDFHLTDWLTFRAKGDFLRLNAIREDKILGNGDTGYSGSSYSMNTSHRESYKITGMLSALKEIGSVNLNGSVALEQWDYKSGYLNSWTDGGLNVPGQFILSNSINAAKTEGLNPDSRQRINSVYAFLNLDWKHQLYVDLTARNDWSSTLVYPNGSGNNSYFYPSISSSWVFTDTFREYFAKWIDFAKIRASYAIVGNGTSPYVTNIGYYKFDGNFNNIITGGNYPRYIFDSDALRNLDLKPEKTHSVELGAEARLFGDRLRFDVSWYKTNTYNQIMNLPIAFESGVSSRWINAGNIQNTGWEAILNIVPIDTKDFRWDMDWNYTRNRNKIVELTPGVDKYLIEAGNLDTYSYATVGEEYGAIYTPYAYKRYQAVDENGNPVDHKNNGKPVLLNTAGQAFKRSGEYVKVGNTQPDFLAGLANSFRYKDFTLNCIIDSKFGGDVVSGTYNYGMASGKLESTLQYRSEAQGGLPRTLTDGRTIHDGVIQNGVYDNGVVINGVNVSGWTMQEAYDKGLVKPIPVSQYYQYKYNWGNGIREEAVLESSWISLREISLWWRMPNKWTKAIHVGNMNVGFICRNIAYLYNTLPDNVHPEGLYSNRTSAFVEVGGPPYSRTYSFKINLSF